MPVHATLSSAILCVLLGAATCGGEPRAIPDPDPASPDAAVPDARPDARPDAPPDSPPPPDAMPDAPPSSSFVSNTPNATVMDIGGTPNLVLVSSNLLQDPPLGGQVFQQWFAEVKNAGSTTVCLTSLDVFFQDSAGTVLASYNTFLDGDPYVSSGLSLTIPCIAPGQIASAYSNDFAPTAVPLDTVTRIAVKMDPFDASAAVPSGHAPIVTSQVTPVFSNEFGITGTLTGVSAPIYNIRVAFYPRDARGLLLGQLVAIDLDTLEPAAAFPFTTLGVSTSFTEHRHFSEFIDGRKPTVQALAEELSPPARALADRLAIRRQRAETMRHRCDLARSR